MSKQTSRAWDMFMKGGKLEEVQLATGLSKATLEVILKDVQRQQQTLGWGDDLEF